jgi:group I intron endonuclease
MNSGIYKITCKVTNKFYIGSSQELKRRKVYHFNRLRANKHPNPHMQNSYNLYGEQSFEYEVIKYCDVVELLKEEQLILNEYVNTGVLFNVALVAGASFRNRRHKKETIKKMKISHTKPWTGKTLSEEHKQKIRETQWKLKRATGVRKLTDDQVLNIRKLHADGLGVRTIGKILNIPRHNVNSIVKGKRYADVILSEFKTD